MERIMRQQGLILAGAAALIIAGCAFGDSEVQTTADPEVFTVWQSYAPARGGLPQSELVAQQMARQKCASMNRDFYPVEETRITWPPRYDLTFRCIDVGGGTGGGG